MCHLPVWTDLTRISWMTRACDPTYPEGSAELTHGHGRHLYHRRRRNRLRRSQAVSSTLPPPPTTPLPLSVNSVALVTQYVSEGDIILRVRLLQHLLPSRPHRWQQHTALSSGSVELIRCVVWCHPGPVVLDSHALDASVVDVTPNNGPQSYLGPGRRTGTRLSVGAPDLLYWPAETPTFRVPAATACLVRLARMVADRGGPISARGLGCV